MYQGGSLLGEEYDDIVLQLSEAIGISECEVRNAMHSSCLMFGYRLVRFQNIPTVSIDVIDKIDIIDNIHRLSCIVI